MSPEEQEALSRAHALDVIRLLPLKGGAWAVYNVAHALCGIAADPIAAIALWYPPEMPPKRQNATLEELGLL